MAIWAVENELNVGPVKTALRVNLLALEELLGIRDELCNGLYIDRILIEGDGINTPLTAAIRAGDVARATQLLKLGAKVDVSDRNGRSPLHVAAITGQAAMIPLLLISGAKMYPKPHELKSPYPYHLSSLAEDYYLDRDVSPFIAAAYCNQPAAISAFMQAGALKEIKDSLIWKPLVKFMAARPVEAAAYALGKNMICREYFAAKRLSHSLDFDGQLQFSGGSLKLEGLFAVQWVCLELLETLHAFIEENPNKLQAIEIQSIETLLRRGSRQEGSSFSAGVEAERSERLKAIKNASPVSPFPIHTGYDRHLVEVVFYGEYFIINNKGIYSKLPGKVCKIDINNLKDLEWKINVLMMLHNAPEEKFLDFLEKFQKAFEVSDDRFSNFIEGLYPTELGLKQRAGTCGWRSIETAVFFTLMMARFDPKGERPSDAAIREAQETFIHLVRLMDVRAVEKYFDHVDRGEMAFNKQLFDLTFQAIEDIVQWPPSLEARIKKLKERRDDYLFPQRTARFYSYYG